jgi:hypothetical protein
MSWIFILFPKIDKPDSEKNPDPEKKSGSKKLVRSLIYPSLGITW